MKIGQLLGWGIVVYAVMRLVWDVLVIYGFSSGWLAHGIDLLVLLLLCIIAGRSLRMNSWNDVLPYSLTWAIIAAVLDAVYVVPFIGWTLYSDPNLWIGYSFVVVFPLLAPLTRLRSVERPAALS